MKHLIDSIIRFEEGELTDEQIIDLFADLIRTGTAWSLQGQYGRTANSLIEHGYLDADGNIISYPQAE